MTITSDLSLPGVEGWTRVLDRDGNVLWERRLEDEPSLERFVAKSPTLNGSNGDQHR